MRAFPLILGIVLLAPSACSSTVATATGGTGGSTSSSHSSSSSATSGTFCIPHGAQCPLGGGTCCEGADVCYGGTCQPCIEPSIYTQCVCGGVAVGPENSCVTGAGCGLDAGLLDGGDGGACQCVPMTVDYPCP